MKFLVRKNRTLESPSRALGRIKNTSLKGRHAWLLLRVLRDREAEYDAAFLLDCSSYDGARGPGPGVLFCTCLTVLTGAGTGLKAFAG